MSLLRSDFEEEKERTMERLAELAAQIKDMRQSRRGSRGSKPTRGKSTRGAADEWDKKMNHLIVGGAAREGEAGEEGKMCDSAEVFIQYFVFGESDEFMGGLASLAGGALSRSMEAEFRTNEKGAWWAEYEYVVLRAAEEDVDLPSTKVHQGKVSLTGDVIRRDRGHSGMTIDDFWSLKEAQKANLTKAEVAALRLYSGPAFRPINSALRRKDVGLLLELSAYFDHS